MTNEKSGIPISNPKLRELLIRRNSISDPESAEMAECMNALLEELAENARFLAAADIPEEGIRREENGDVTILQNTVISFEGIDDTAGNHFLTGYTDWESLRKDPRHASGNVQTIILSFDDFYAMLKDDTAGLAVNPYGENYVMPRALMQHVREVKDMQENGHCDKVIQKDTQVKIGEPADYPTQMIAAISDAAKTDKRIKKIHLKLMVNGEEKSYLLIVDYTGDRKEVFGLLADAGKPYLPKDMFLDIVSLNENSWQKVADNKPFYRKKIFG